MRRDQTRPGTAENIVRTVGENFTVDAGRIGQIAELRRRTAARAFWKPLEKLPQTDFIGFRGID